MSEYHTPVMLDESITALITNPQGTYADCTFGGGGHTAEILSRLQDGGRVIAFDRDSDALANAPDDPRLTLVHNNFRFIENYAELLRREEPGKRVFPSEPMATLGHVRGRGPACREGSERSEDGSEENTLLPGTPEVFDGILADLGVSSHQFDTAERGFSFRYDAPLDMRMGRESSITAADIVNTRSQEDLERILRLYGEVDGARNIARLIVAAREKEEIRTTGDLDRAIERALPKMAAHKQLAKIYQALRIEVNQEMRSLEKFLDGAARCLKPGGRLVVITYHSLEDRMVKNFIRTGNVEGKEEKDLFGRIHTPLVSSLRKPLTPGEAEIAGNTRARSAKLRVAEKPLPDGQGDRKEWRKQA